MNPTSNDPYVHDEKTPHLLPIHERTIAECERILGESWRAAKLIPLGEGSLKGLAQRIDGCSKVLLILKGGLNPAEIARYLRSFAMEEYQFFILEHLGQRDERFAWYALAEAELTPFSSVPVVLVKQIKPVQTWSLGIADEAFHQRKPDKGLITKKEIRTLSLAALQLTADSIVWDIGTCTGSIAIEAARIARNGMVYAIEKNEADLENCKKNMRKFRADLMLFHGKAPEYMEEFPAPDAVFIGGTSDNLQEILQICCDKLKPQGRIVLNAVTIEKLCDTLAFFASRDFRTTITLAQISRSKPILELTRFEAQNPIYIITARREDEI